MRETDYEFGQMHDRWLADYRHSVETAYCTNPTCDNRLDGITVDYESEYGQGWTQPEDCPICHADLTFDRPDPPDEDDDETPQEPISAPATATPDH